MALRKIIIFFTSHTGPSNNNTQAVIEYFALSPVLIALYRLTHLNLKDNAMRQILLFSSFYRGEAWDREVKEQGKFTQLG